MNKLPKKTFPNIGIMIRLNNLLCKRFGHKWRRIEDHTAGIGGIGCTRCKKGQVFKNQVQTR